MRDDAGRIVDFRFDYANVACAASRDAPLHGIIGQLIGDLDPAMEDALRRVLLTGEPATLRSSLSDAKLDGRGHLDFEMKVSRLGDGVVVSGRDAASATLASLKHLGVKIAVDDFGTGYSSLTHLIKFPIDIIKIDKSFIDRVADGTDGEVMVRAVVDLAHSLGLRAIAEGVERTEQAQALEHLGCHLAQGYLFAKPVPAPDMAALVAQHAVSTVDSEATMRSDAGPVSR